MIKNKEKKEEMTLIGLQDMLNVIGTAIWKKDDRNFSQKLTELLNKSIRIEISVKDWDYIVKNYTK